VSELNSMSSLSALFNDAQHRLFSDCRNVCFEQILLAHNRLNFI